MTQVSRHVPVEPVEVASQQRGQVGDAGRAARAVVEQQPAFVADADFGRRLGEVDEQKRLRRARRANGSPRV